jgi:hypothetical protein
MFYGDEFQRDVSIYDRNIRGKRSLILYLCDVITYVNNLKSLQILYNILRPTYRIRLVVCNSYHGVCNRVNSRIHIRDGKLVCENPSEYEFRDG